MAFAAVMPTIAIAESGVITNAWPAARVTSGRKYCRCGIVDVEVQVQRSN